MSSAPRFFAQIVSIASGIRSYLRGFPGEFRKLLAGAESAVDGKLGKAPARGRKLALVATLAALSVFLVVFAVASLLGRDPGDALRASPPEAGWDLAAGLIPLEELFLPDEPDFVPGVLLWREQRPEWAAEDAEAWWRNPLSRGEALWRDRLERMVDDIMENVP